MSVVCHRSIYSVPATLMSLLAVMSLVASGAGAAEPNTDGIDILYECVVVYTPTDTDQVTTLPEGLTNVTVGDTVYAEFWATDAGTTNTGSVSAYADLTYAEGCVTASAIVHTDLFDLFADGSDTGSKIDELGGSQLTGGVGVEPEWARIACVEFTATQACGAVEFHLL